MGNNVKHSILGLSEWETRVADFKSLFFSCRLTFPEFMEMRNSRILQEINRKHGKRAVYPAYVRGYVSGLMRGIDADLYQNHLEYCYIENGVLFSTHRESVHRKTEEFHAANRGAELGNLPSGHFWRGTDKPYYLKGGL